MRPYRTSIDNLMETTTIACAMFIYGAAVMMSIPGYGYGAIVVEVFYFIVNVVVMLWCAIEFLRANFPAALALLRSLSKRGKRTSVVGVTPQQNSLQNSRSSWFNNDTGAAKDVSSSNVSVANTENTDANTDANTSAVVDFS